MNDYAAFAATALLTTSVIYDIYVIHDVHTLRDKAIYSILEKIVFTLKTITKTFKLVCVYHFYIEEEEEGSAAAFTFIQYLFGH